MNSLLAVVLSVLLTAVLFSEPGNSQEDETSRWTIQTVDDMDYTGAGVSLALGPDGSSHMSFYNTENDTLCYAVRTWNSWEVETVDDFRLEQDESYYSSIKIDTQGGIHIAYTSYSALSLRYAYSEGDDWTVEIVDGGYKSGSYPSMALDSTDMPHISYFDKQRSDLKYARKNSTGWHVEMVDGDDTVGKCTSIAIDLQDRPHISYWDFTNYALKYCHFNGTDWNAEIIDSSAHTGLDSSIAVDKAGVVHISYYNLEDFDLMYARLIDGEWDTERVDSRWKVGDGTSLALDHFSKVYIAYFDWSHSSLKLASGNFGFWELETLDYDIWVRPGGSHHASISIDENGDPHIGYYYGTVQRNPRYATLDGTIPEPDEFTVIAGDAKVDVSWKVETEGRFDQVSGFQLFREGIEGEMMKIADLIPGSTDYKDDDVTNGITYYYQLFVVNGQDELLRMDTLSATPLGVPSAPTSLNMTMDGDLIRVSWEPPVDDGGTRILGYTIYRYDTEMIKTETFNSMTVSDTYLEQNDVDCERGRTYEYWVTAFNDAGEGESTQRVNGILEEKEESVDTVSWFVPVFVIFLVLAVISVILIMLLRKKDEKNFENKEVYGKGRKYR